MYAEKSTNLLRQYRRFKLTQQRCLLVKYSGDNRYTDENYIATHDRVVSTERAVSCHHLSLLEKEVDLRNFDVICIDELQFYPDNLAYCQKWRAQGKTIIACGLYADFERKPFNNMPELIAISDKIEFLTAICVDCRNDGATTSFRMSDEKEQVVIGGHDKYVPLCQICYEKRKN
jgi:thymidine kinase